MSLGKIFDKAKVAFDKLLEAYSNLPYPENPNDITDDQLRQLMAVPTIMPCSSDRTIDFWLTRLANAWGKCTYTYVDPDTKQRSKMSMSAVGDLFADDERIALYGKWSWRQINDHSVEMFREFYDENNRIHRESVVVDIEIKPEIKRAMKGKIR